MDSLKMKLCAILLVGTLAVCLCAAAQESLGNLSESDIALLRSGIQARKTGIVQQNLVLSDEQAKKFWPLQRSYENDLSKLEDQRIDLIREYTKNWDNLTDETVQDLRKRLFDYQKKRLDLRNKYFDRMSREISPTIAAKFFQLEMHMEDLIDLEFGSAVPPVK